MNGNAIDWNALESRAAEMSTDAIRYAIADIHKTLPFADDMDRLDGQDRGGRYRDEASIYWRELRRRGHAH